MKILSLRFLVLVGIYLSACCGIQAYSQQKTDSLLISKKDSLIVLTDPSLLPDSVPEEFVPTLDELIKKGRRYSLQSNEIQMELSKTLDTLALASEIAGLQEIVSSIEQRSNASDQNYNFRFVNALRRIINTSEDQAQELDLIVQEKLDRLEYFDSLLSTIRNDNFFKFKIKDSLLLPNYSQEIELLKKNLQLIDSAIFHQELQAARFQSQLSFIAIKISRLHDFIEQSKSQLEKAILQKELNYLWEDYSISSPKSVLKITLETLELNWALFKRQIRAHVFSTVFSILVLLTGIFLVQISLPKLNESSTESEQSLIISRLRFLVKSPIIGVIIAFTPILIFLFDLGSVTFVTFSLIIQVLLCTVVIFRTFGKALILKWLVILLVFLLFAISNLYWEIAYQERMYFLIGSILVILVLTGLKKQFKSELQLEHRLLAWGKTITVFLLCLSILANFFGRYSLAKILGVAGVSGFVYFINLFFFVNLLTEIVFLLIEGKKEVNYITTFLNFKEIQKRIKNILVAIAIFIWVITLVQNLALSQYFAEYLSDFLLKERVLGDSTFTFGSVLLFIGILFLSSVLANNFAYFISLKDQNTTDIPGKKLGSSVLIFRLLILTLGFFIAATAAKIPLDKITIVLGALSVGIGFGLQTIINNLVSGVILAFEKPIQIGDDIEVGTMSGKVKEIGIRASKILAYDGSEIVVPNGNLLSESLINWTLSDKRRRVELIIGVAYDSDMKKVRELILQVLQRERVMKFPEPRVLMHNFNDSSVDFRVLFWVDTMDIFLEMRNEVMTAIFDTFLENGIEIPFPKRDLYLKTLPENLQKPGAENKKSPEE
ncbi:MAG: mechanosensitive ion channel [Cyclobacteriaceae bacterium]|nr:mechanosensitive ion channel [Cyclobacteriaceae bacterium]MDX5465789.1 mechanosensitive ion channel [Cyclobacteriaceae bacterium]